MKIVFLTRSLEVGGAEVQIVAMAKGLAARGHDIGIVTFYPGGELESEIDGTGVDLMSVGKRGRWDMTAFTFRLARVLRRLKPSIIHSFLGPPNILAAMLSPVLNNAKIIWGVRASDMELGVYDWSWRGVAKAERLMSPVPTLVVSNSYAGLHFAVSKGFRESSMTVVSNGIDVTKFHPDRNSAHRFKQMWQRNEDEILIGIAARLDPMKDHLNFLRAAASFKATGVNARYICVGHGPSEYESHLRSVTSELGLDDDVVWAGYQKEMSKVYNAFDISCQSSAFGEGFPNSVGEAMASCVPCAVTDVGDSAWIVGDAGYVVAKKDPSALAGAWRKWLELDSFKRAELGILARRQIEQNFSVRVMLDKSEEIYREVIAN